MAVAGSFAIGAKNLYLSRSALSRQIIALEKQLNVKLFSRYARGLLLTKHGQILYEASKKAISEMESIRSSMQKTFTDKEKTIKIASTEGISFTFLINKLSEFMKKNPEVKLIVLNNDQEPAFSPKEIDAAIWPFIPGATHLIQQLLLSSPLKLYASPQYLKKYGTPETLEELDSHRLLGYGTHIHPFSELNWHLSAGTSPGQSRRPVIQINSGASLIHLAEQGLGIATFPQDNQRLRYSNLVEIMPKAKSPSLDLCFTYPERLRKSQQILQLSDYIMGVTQKIKSKKYIY